MVKEMQNFRSSSLLRFSPRLRQCLHEKILSRGFKREGNSGGILNTFMTVISALSYYHCIPQKFTIGKWKKTYDHEILGNLESPCLAQVVHQASKSLILSEEEWNNDFKLKILFAIRMKNIGTLIFFKLLPFNPID